jgi:hypothetical protein
MLSLCMKADTEQGKKARGEIIAIVQAWARGDLLPPSAAPILSRIYGRALGGER